MCFHQTLFVPVKLPSPHPGGGQPPQAFELLKIGFFKFPPLRAKKPFKLAPPISTEIPLPKNKILLESNTVHAFQREICRKDSFKFLLKTLVREKFTNKGEILPCKSVKPCKNQKKNSQAHCARDKSGSNSPPFQGNVQIPPSLGTMHSQLPGVFPGGL